MDIGYLCSKQIPTNIKKQQQQRKHGVWSVHKLVYSPIANDRGDDEALFTTQVNMYVANVKE